MNIRNWLAYKILVEVKNTYISILKQIHYCIRRIISITREHYYDKRLGIRTSDTCFFKEDPSSHKDGQIYQPTSYQRLEAMIDYLKLRQDDVFIDLGCGKGRAIFLVATQKLKKVVGVEVREELADIAKENLKNLRSNKTPIEIFNADAADFDVRDGTAFFMFNPFGDKTLAKVVDNVKASLRTNPRNIRIVYYNPAHRHLLNSQDWLAPEGEIDKTGIFVWRNTTG